MLGGWKTIYSGRGGGDIPIVGLVTNSICREEHDAFFKKANLVYHKELVKSVNECRAFFGLFKK